MLPASLSDTGVETAVGLRHRAFAKRSSDIPVGTRALAGTNAMLWNRFSPAQFRSFFVADSAICLVIAIKSSV